MRYKIFLKTFLPFFLILSLYYVFFENIVYGVGSLKTIRLRSSVSYAQSLSGSEVDYVIAGDSTAAFGLDPKTFSENSHSISTVSALNYTSYMLLSHLENTKINKGIILTQSFIADHYNADIWKTFVPSKVFSFQDVMNVYCVNKKPECSIFDYIPTAAKYLLSRTHLSPHAFDEAIESYSHQKDIAHNYINTLKEHNGLFKRYRATALDEKAFFSPLEKYFSQSLADPPASEFYYLGKIFEIAKKKNINVYFVIMPLATAIKNTQTDNYNSSITRIISKFPKQSNVFIINARKIEQTLSRNDFWDFSHLSDQGSRRISQYVLDEINSIVSSKIAQTESF